MIRKLLLGLGASLLTVGSLPIASAAAATTNPIWCALRAGANLDIEAVNKCDTAKPAAPRSAPQPAATPSTSTGVSSSTSAGTNASGASTASQASQPSSATSGTYVALGDSVAAGLGLPLSSTATTSDSQCGRSTQGYPYIVASQLHMTLTDVACSGATAGDLVTQQHISGSNPPAQLSAAYASGTPKLITITAGANDVHWASFIKGCYAYDCTGTVYQVAASTYLSLLRAKLYYVLSDIQNRSGSTPPTVLLTGYYDPIEANCAQQQSQITPAEINWIGHETTALNSVVQQTAADFSFARYVPISFAGHGICSSNPWIQGLTAAAPLHPTVTGQRQIANRVLHVYNN